MALTDAFRDIVVALIGIVAGAGLGLAIRTVALSRIAAVTAHTVNRIDDVIVAAVRTPLVLWTTLVGLHVSLSFTALPPRNIEAVHGVIVALVIVSISWTLAQVVGGLIGTHPLAPPGTALPSARILSTGAKAMVLGLGLLVALQTLGVSVAPVLTALGVGGLAVGLALQDTLANLFAGFHILASRQLRPGDFVKLSTGEGGFVDDISWRNTTIRQLPNNIVIVPNAQLAQAITLNYNLPDAEQAVVVDLGVSYDEDLAHVERVTIEVARGVQREVAGAVPRFEPFVRFHTFADSQIGFSVIMRGQQFTDNYLIKHEFVRRLHDRYRAERITIPYPQRTLHVSVPETPGILARD